MRFLADMGVSKRVVEWLRAHGHDATHLAELKLQRLPNGEIFEKAIKEGRIVLTFDLDFGEIISQLHGERMGVVLFRLNNTATQFVIKRLQFVLPDVQESLSVGAIVVIEDSRHRIRRFPF